MTNTQLSEAKPEVEEILARIVRVVRWSSEFVLGFVKCNSPVQQKQLSRMLLERLSDKRAVEITLDEPIISLLERLTTVVDVNDPPAFVNVFGLEKSIYAQEDYSPVLGRLNNDRDLIRRACPAVLLIWLPDYALDKVVISAPDFWAWRSGVYEFPTNSGHFQSDSLPHLNTSWPDMSNLTIKEKHQEIARLEELLRTAHSLPNLEDRVKEIISRLLYQTGVLYESIGDWQEAKRRFEESKIYLEEQHNSAGIAAISEALATIEEDQGNLDNAQQLYERSLHLSKQANDLNSMAVSLRHLGTVQSEKGNFEAAQLLYQQSLQIFEGLIASGREAPVNMAGVLLGLANLYCDQKKIDEAQSLYYRVLAIADETGQKHLRGIVLHQLGGCEHLQGNLIAALHYHQESLEIALELGNEHSLSLSLAQIGELKMEVGCYQEAVTYLQSALTKLQSLQSPHAEAVDKWLRDVREIVGNEQFEEWVQHTKSVSSF